MATQAFVRVPWMVSRRSCRYPHMIAAVSGGSLSPTVDAITTSFIDATRRVVSIGL